MIQGMNHFTVLTDDLDKTLGFYVDLLGLKPGPRPDLGFPGAWLYVNGSAVLHIIAGRRCPSSVPGCLITWRFRRAAWRMSRRNWTPRRSATSCVVSAARAPGSCSATTPVVPRWSSISIRRNQPD